MTEARVSRWAYLAALAPMIFGTTYLLTSEFLPPGRPLLAALMRSLPTGLVLIIGSQIPTRKWMLRFFVLSVLYCSALFPLLFIAAYRLPGGVAAVINSLSPLLVVVLSVPLLHTKIRSLQIIAGLLGIGGVALLVLRSTARLDVLGILAMVGAVTMMGTATVLTKRWGRPDGMNSIGVTGWTFLLGGLTLLPFTLIFEGLPNQLSARNIGGLVYLVLISGILAYALWFWGLQRLAASSVTFLSLLNPVVAAVLGWIVLSQRLNGWQIFGAIIVLISVVLGQPLSFDRLRRRRPRGRRLTIVSASEPKPPRERWPRSLYATGTEPDPRFTFANERTFLAWIRTGLGFLAAGVAIAAVAQLTERLGVEVRIASIILVVCGLACGIGAFSRWMINERAMRLGQPLPSSRLLLVLTSVVAVVGVIALVVVSLG